MTIYRFDWKDIIYGRVEIEASSGQEAHDKLMGIRIKDLLHISQFNSDNNERSIRFADAVATKLKIWMPTNGIS